MSLLEHPRIVAPGHSNAAPLVTKSVTSPRKSRSTRALATTVEVAKPRRDPFLDLLRAFGTVAVIIAHWLMPQASWDGHTLEIVNVLGSGPGWLVTWVVQVIPLMFFVAGAATFSQMSANTVAWGPFMAARVARILPPVAVFLATWVVLAQGLPLLGVPETAVMVAATIAPQLLWYLGIYVILLAASHGLRACYKQFGLGSVVALGAGAVLVDAVRFMGGIELVGIANLFCVWAFAYTLGYAYADGRLDLPRRGSAAIAGCGLIGLIVAVTVGPYPASMVGMPGDAISNMGPPTLCLVALTLLQVFGALTVRRPLVALAENVQVRAVVRWISARSMTLYLWHLTAMFVVVGIVTVGANVDLPEGWTSSWWVSRPLWFAACLVVLLGLTRLFAPVESRRVGRPASNSPMASAVAPVTVSVTSASATSATATAATASNSHVADRGRTIRR